MTSNGFDKDNEYGLKAEAYAKRVGAALMAGESRAEIKHKRYLDDRFYVEFEQHSRHGTGEWVPSGVLVHKGPLYCFVVGNTGVLVAIPTQTLIEALAQRLGALAEQPSSFGGNPTRGRLITLQDILALRRLP